METPKTTPTWEELLGTNHWEGLLTPLSLPLRQLILQCGDFCQATYDSFNNDQNSKYCGSCRYGKGTLFDKVALPNAATYFVDTYLYATARIDLPEVFKLHSSSSQAWDRESNWMGYIAVTTDEASKELGRREVYVAWRGTLRTLEWVNVLNPQLASVKPLLKGGENMSLRKSKGGSSSSDSDDESPTPKIMEGWLNIYTSENPNSSFTKLSARTQLLTKIKQLIDRYKDEKLSITFAGHSLGASLSVVSAFDIAENVTPKVPVTAFVFGCPEVGNKEFKDRLNTYPNLRVLHVKNIIDPIPHYPSRLLGYVHTGIELDIDTRKSPSLKPSNNPSDWHNLQAMLHILAGWNGAAREFELKVKRSLALVNKSCDFLKEECLVPASWWVEKNKGMVLDKDGEWVMAPPDDEDVPVPEF